MSTVSHIKENIKGKNAHAASCFFPKLIHILCVFVRGGKKKGQGRKF